ncbi:unnamed protein product [Bursaphelenchus okinawaensis]|uniref:Serine/threonine-protein phosphatase 2A activator n=1 Tax=Bursaphelenchus okinawaensis TaxID=465554 RepID=A0A811LMZ8_9BILA|nr:unnamed protein product [Bursaphelenchus okinawaensis]CAG9125070.1 unnamed protein product [Bursaphelenchus okinawaensis]
MSQVEYVVPKREIFNIFDINKWYKSEAYTNYLNFLKRLSFEIRGLPTTSSIEIPSFPQKIIETLDVLDGWIEDFPPVDMGEQRFGNKAYAKWHERLVEKASEVLGNLLPEDLQAAIVELTPYLLDSFGNATRIDYGSGHEAAFLVLLYCLYQIGCLHHPEDDKAVVLRVFARYLKLCRKLQTTYRMEPAGSRGVHAIDDFQFAPFLLGSSQLIGNRARLTPDDYLKEDQVLIYQHDNLFFEAVQYINNTKTGLFYEHSNQLYNISAVPNWEKVNSGLFKMYEGEVLKKFPVVQHFLFGNLFSIKEKDSEKMADDLVPNDPVAEEKPAHLDAISEE